MNFLLSPALREGCSRRSKNGRAQQANAGYQRRERNPLRIGKAEVQPLLVETEKFDDEARCRIKREIPAENRARGVGLADAEIQKQKNQRVGETLVELRGM